MNRLNLKRITVLLIVVMVTGIFTIVQSQPRLKEKRNGEKPPFDLRYKLPDLTDDQLAKLDELHTNMLVETTPLKKKLLIKRAELDAMSSEKNVDMQEINSKIDEISGLQGEIMKKREANKQEIRKMLNDKQRIHFDNLRHPVGRHHEGDFFCKERRGKSRNFERFGPGMQGEDILE